MDIFVYTTTPKTGTCPNWDFLKLEHNPKTGTFLGIYIFPVFTINEISIMLITNEKCVLF